MHCKLRVREESTALPALQHLADSRTGKRESSSALGERFSLFPGARGASSSELGLRQQPGALRA
jgi:hypothetical protein